MKRPWWLPGSRARREAELDDEVRGHLHLAEAERIARGESATDAAANARRELGNAGQVKEATREQWGGMWVDRLVQDLRFGARMLRRSPGFTLLAVTCLTLGVGANAAVYSWIEGILLRPYPLVVAQDRLFVVAGTARGVPGTNDLSWPEFLDLRKNSRLVESFVADKITGTTLSIGDRAERVSGQIVSANYFDAIGVRPTRGRGFEAAEESGRNAHPVTVISYKLWMERFKGDPGIIGRSQLLNGLQHTIVGVAPEGFNGTFVGYAMQFWVPVDLNLSGYDTQRKRNFQDELMARVQALPGVESAAYARIAPFSYRSYSWAPLTIDGYVPGPDEQPSAEYDEVGPGYFATMAIPLVSGREFARSDDETGRLVAVVNEAMAAKYWPSRAPIGRVLTVKGRRMEVVGVAKMSKYGSLLEPARPFFYVPLRQNPAGVVMLHLRTRVARGQMGIALARELHALDAGVAPSELITMGEEINRQSSAQTVALSLLGTFGGLALLLAAIGLYGVMSYAVSQSRRELGLRMALGARGSDVLRLVMANGLTLTAGGLLLGLAAALLMTRLLGDLLYHVSPRDPPTFGFALVVMTLTSLAACVLPARRAARTDPLRALRG